MFKKQRSLLIPVLLLLALAAITLLTKTRVASVSAERLMDETGCEAITFTHVPAYGSSEYLRGQVTCVNPLDFKVAVYIYYAGWYNKPTWAQPLTTISPDGTWMTNITTGGNDPIATKIVAFLWPNDGTMPPLMSGGSPLPELLFDTGLAYTHIERTARQLTFAGRTWHVKATTYPEGPGPNLFSDAPGDVWVDSNGRMHLTIHFRNGVWHSTEIFTTEPLGYGLYSYTISSPVENLDPNVVVGLFSWDSVAPAAAANRELDIEFSRWGNPANPFNAQWVVAPYYLSGHLQSFNITGLGSTSLHRFLWVPTRIDFEAFQGHIPDPQAAWDTWTYTGSDIPPADDGNARLNLWLLSGNAPLDGQEVEVIISDFTFIPIIGPYEHYLPLLSQGE